MQAEARGDFCGRDQRPELGKDVLAPERPAGTPTHGPAQETPGAPAEEQGGIPIPSASLLQVTERRQPLSSVSSLEVHFDLLDLTELTDMSDQELAEVFADSDEENAASEAPSARTCRPAWENRDEGLGLVAQRHGSPVPGLSGPQPRMGRRRHGARSNR